MQPFVTSTKVELEENTEASIVFRYGWRADLPAQRRHCSLTLAPAGVPETQPQ